MEYVKSCGAVVFNGDEFLLLKYDAGHWGFPKGHVEEGESEKETALRELREETGISDVEFVPGFREEVSYSFKAGGVRKQKTVVFFLAETDEGGVVLSDEHRGYAWLSYEEALERLTYPEPEGVLEEAKRHLEAHDSRLDEYF